MRIGSICSGYGGLDIAVAAHYGATVAWHTERDPAAARILAHHHPDVPNHGDITAVDWRSVEPVDVICGGTPCQDLSHAGARRGMRAGTRSGIWASMCDAVETIRPAVVVWENVRGALSAAADSNVEPCPLCMGDAADVSLRAIGRVLGDLSELGYDASWGTVRASDAGAPHERARVFVVATDTDRAGPEGPQSDGGPHADADNDRRTGPGDQGGAQGSRGGRADAERLADAAPHTGGQRYGRRKDPRMVGRVGPASESSGRDPRAPRTVARDRSGTDAPDPHSGRLEGFGEPAGVAVSGAVPDGRDDTRWGPYAAAVRRWESVLWRPAPCPTEPSTGDRARLSPRFVEWMMGLPAGWVNDVPGVSRTDQLKALGNGVVPQQAALALRAL